MPSIFKYVSKEEHARKLIERGELYLQSLAYFRAYEDGSVRGDPDDGKLQYQPVEGLTITKQNGQVLLLPEARFRASVSAENIYVYCMSSKRSEYLAERFQSPCCVEIRDPGALFAKVKGSVRLRSKLDHRNLYRGPVEYRALEVMPGADWALPQRVAFIKPPAWSWQMEYRIVVGRKGAFDFQNVGLALEKGGADRGVRMSRSPMLLAVGDLSRHAVLHRF